MKPTSRADYIEYSVPCRIQMQWCLFKSKGWSWSFICSFCSPPFPTPLAPRLWQYYRSSMQTVPVPWDWISSMSSWCGFATAPSGLGDKPLPSFVRLECSLSVSMCTLNLGLCSNVGKTEIWLTFFGLFLVWSESVWSQCWHLAVPPQAGSLSGSVLPAATAGPWTACYPRGKQTCMAKD